MAGDTTNLGNLIEIGVVGLDMIEGLDLDLDVFVSERKNIDERRLNFSDDTKEGGGVNERLTGLDEGEISGGGSNKRREINNFNRLTGPVERREGIIVELIFEKKELALELVVFLAEEKVLIADLG